MKLILVFHWGHLKIDQSPRAVENPIGRRGCVWADAHHPHSIGRGRSLYLTALIMGKRVNSDSPFSSAAAVFSGWSRRENSPFSRLTAYCFMGRCCLCGLNRRTQAGESLASPQTFSLTAGIAEPCLLFWDHKAWAAESGSGLPVLLFPLILYNSRMISFGLHHFGAFSGRGSWKCQGVPERSHRLSVGIGIWITRRFAIQRTRGLALLFIKSGTVPSQNCVIWRMCYCLSSC